MSEFDLFKWRRLQSNQQSINEGSNASRWFGNLKYYYEKGLKSPDLRDPAEKKAYIKLAKQFFSRLKEGHISEGVYDKILKAVPDSYSYKKLAVDIAKMIKDEYGSHNIKPFMKELSKLLKEGTINESLGINDPVLVAIRAMKTQMKKKTPVKKIKKVSFDQYLKLIDIQEDLVEDMKDTAEDIQDLFRNMEQEAEPSGGPIADKYGAQLDKLEKKYADLKKKKAVVDKRIENYRMS